MSGRSIPNLSSLSVIRFMLRVGSEAVPFEWRHSSVHLHQPHHTVVTPQKYATGHFFIDGPGVVVCNSDSKCPRVSQLIFGFVRECSFQPQSPNIVCVVELLETLGTAKIGGSHARLCLLGQWRLTSWQR
eukprot:GHVN01054491.1.p1 GENE.GHVN01054491.1~~GHVN01054491.1.p1  ORF type:complete len:130 (-),score=10.62 GHVN01054491.1:297-686(-)